MNFGHILLNWYRDNHRDLPWRNTKNPYLIWLSEVILQQTRVQQGLPYYEAFAETYPTVKKLAQAPEAEVLKLWQGLGYYSRARNLLQTAQIIDRELDGIFPNTFQKLIQLKGIGPYTAAAIASFAFDESVAVVDGNVFRVLARIYGIEIDITSSLGKKTFTELAQTLLNKHPPSEFNQAMMEFGAMHCTPQNPLCHSCPFQDICLAFSQKKTALLPIKKKKKTSQKRYLHYGIIWDHHQKITVNQRSKTGIWRGLYEFPLIEMELNEMPNKSNWQSLFSTDIQCSSEFPIGGRTWSHKLTHQDLEIRFWELQLNGIHVDGLAVDDLYKLPVPIILHKFMVWYWGNR